MSYVALESVTILIPIFKCGSGN